MEESIKEFIKELEKKGCNFLGQEDPDAKVNVWYVVAKLEEIYGNSKK